MVIIEVILASLLQNELVNLSVILVSDWLVRQKIDDTRSCIYDKDELDETDHLAKHVLLFEDDIPRVTCRLFYLRREIAMLLAGL